METSFQLPRAGVVTEHEDEIKRSRFIALVGRVESEAEAREFIAEARHRFPDARHHCSAYVLHVPGAQPVERSSDDGEPSGTAGKPMLDVVKGSGMRNICAVVVRYFGGVKLGAGGLVHAYGGAVSAAMADVPRVTRSLKELYSVHVGHAAAGWLEADLRARKADVRDVRYAADVEIVLATWPGGGEELAELLAGLTQGEIHPKRVGEDWVET
ncbi:IMPACT family protein [Corynebacterium massiliense]|uniref:IMPACT family member YigZ n=1 Tax=Corynebacterium massiliense DSM 45435 TaxID=1121364 RepID=A0ABY7U7Z8_9CORY|nr:YigZ family protein [Corynebacterium massiliense]WCZ32825.1 IMPACT family member YigZ [Corynebacterium massiliense DSM 45435]